MPIPGIISESDSSNRDIDFIDEPLKPVTQDNIDITCQIDNLSYSVVDVEVNLTEGSSSNWVDGIIVPDGHDVLPSEGDVFTLDVDNELMEVRPDTNGEITRIFTGVISNASRIEQGAFEFMAFWPGFNEIQNGNIIIQPAVPLLESSGFSDGGSVSTSTVDYTSRRQYAEDIARQIGTYVTDDTNFDFTVNLKEGGYQLNGITYGDNTRMVVDGERVPLVTSGNDEGVLERVIKATNSVWEVDRYGNFHIGPPLPDLGANANLPTTVTSHKLRYITKTTAGIQSPAWASIVVVGDGVVSQDGWSKSALLSESPQKFSSPIITPEIQEGVQEDLAQPVFEYTNLEINTANEAKHVLQKLREQILKQRANGEVTVVGHPEVWPGDAIELPDTKNQPFGLKRFAVEKVVHRLNNSDGFLTKISVMGQTNATESTFSNEIGPEELNEDRYDTYYTEEELTRIREGRQGL